VLSLHPLVDAMSDRSLSASVRRTSHISMISIGCVCSSVLGAEWGR
jgi:hypothetical protein